MLLCWLSRYQHATFSTFPFKFTFEFYKTETMKRIFFTASIITALVLGACNQKAETKTETAPTPETKKIVVKLSDLSSNKDFVCDMPLEEGGITDTASFEGKLYGFCSTECKDSFALKPSSYLAQK